MRGEQVAFDAVGEEGERALALAAGGDVLALRRQPLGDPLRQGLALDRIDAHRDAGAVERREPGARLLRAVEARQLHERDHVAAAARRGDVAVALQRLRAVLAGLARRDADLDQLAVGEQAQRLRRAEQAAPVEVRAGDGVHLALAAAGGACRGADRVGGFLGEQRLVAPDRVDGAQLALAGGRRVGRRRVACAPRPVEGPRESGPTRAGAAPARRCRSASPGRGTPPPAPWRAPRSRCR